MFKFLRTVAEVLGRAGLKVMTNGVRADWLFCGRGFKASWREMLRTRFTSLFRRRRLYPRNARKFIVTIFENIFSASLFQRDKASEGILLF